MPPQSKQRRQTKRQLHPWSRQCFSARKQKSVVTGLMKNLSEPFRVETHFREMWTYYWFIFFSYSLFFFLATHNAFPPAGKCKCCKSSFWHQKLIRNVFTCSRLHQQLVHKDINTCPTFSRHAQYTCKKHGATEAWGFICLCFGGSNMTALFIAGLSYSFTYFHVAGTHRVRIESLNKTTSSIPGF